MAPWCQNGISVAKNCSSVHIYMLESSFVGKVHKCRNLCYDLKNDYEINGKVFDCVVLYSGNRILKSSLI